MKKYLFILLLISFFSCKKEQTKQITNLKQQATNNIKYASGFDIQYFKNYKKLIIKSPYPKAEKAFTYILYSNNKKLSFLRKQEPLVLTQNFIKVPIKKIVVTSTTHIPMLELLNEENSLIGFPHTEYISSPKTRALISKKNITELGKEENINTELLLDLNPELVVGFSMSSNNKMFANIKKAGIPVILNGDWLEKTPLGRAEWIKFFGALFDKKEQASSIFKNIEKQYNEAKTVAKSSKDRPKVLSGIMYKDKWNLPAGKSYGTQFLKDANVNYPWQETEGTGSLSLSFESVFDKAKDATIWINPGYFNSYQQLQEANQHYTKFDAFTNKKVYNFINKKGETGGVLYYELAPVQPHIVLKDIIKIVHPNLLEDYQPYYLEKLD